MAATLDSMAKIQTGLVQFQKTLTMVEEENSNNKLTEAKASDFFNSLIPQLRDLGNMMGTQAQTILDIKKETCRDTEEAIRQGKINRDNIDDTDQRNMVGSLLINVMDNNLKKDLGVEDDRAYDDINNDALVRSISNRYKVDLRADDIYAAKRISKSGTLKIAFKDIKPGSK